MDGHDVPAVAVTKPAHPVPPTWQPPKTKHPLPKGRAEVRLGTSPAAKQQAHAANQRPAAGSDTAAAGLPVSLAPIEGSALGGQKIQVEVIDPATSSAAGIPGPVLTLRHGESEASGALRVNLDAAALTESYGADWVSRMRLVTMPACSLTTPQVAGCLAQTPVESQVDLTTKKVSGDVVLPGGDTAAAKSQSQGVAAAAAPQGVVLAAVTGSDSGAGKYSATPMNISQAWSAGSSSGSFSYSYPIQAPPTLGGAAPAVALSYDSAAVDGKTSSTNSQASWIGDGWDYSAGFVERSYQSCSKAGITNSGDQCWAGANLTLSLAGHSGELVPHDASCQAGAPATTEQSACTWRLKGDDGSKVEFLTSASNGTWNGSYIKLTDTSGTAYYFGLAHLPDASGNPSTKGPDSGSAWTVPVYSPNAGDPCYDSAKGKASWCQMAWRWNLDYIVDPHGNLINYTYAPETNYYSRGGGQNNGTGTSTAYTRTGVLQSIAYGQLLSDQITANGAYKSAAKIIFASGERCVTSVAACDSANRTSANAANWPDTPLDQQCAQTGACTNYGPTFWSSKWLNSITTQVRYNGAYQDVDLYTLDHRFVDVVNSTENTKVPWLGSVKRTGKDTQASTTEVPLNPVSFTEMLLQNRVDGTNLVPSRPAYNRPRIQLITTETGSTIGVDYYPADCSRINNVMPDKADTDTRSCYNVKWHTPSDKPDADPVDDWFQRYPVKTVTVNPGTPGSATMTTAYTYGAAAWHRNDSPFTDNKDRTWDQFRGYATVTTQAGSGADGPKSQSTVTYHQGMDGDITSAGTPRSITVTGPMGTSATDSDWLSGQALENDSYNQAGGTVTSYSAATSSEPTVTATHNQTGVPALTARYSAKTNVSTVKSLKSDGTWFTATRTTVADSTHNNRTTSVLDTADGAPDACARTSYGSGPDPQVTALVSEVVTVSGADACSATPNAQNTLTWSRVRHDGKPLGEAGAKAEITATENLDRYDGSTAVFVTDATTTYDAYGRPLSATNPRVTDSAHPAGAAVTTAYSAQQAGELPTGTTVTSPAPAGAADQSTGRTTVTTLDSARGLTRTSTDANGRTTTVGYDALGRTAAVWLPGRSTSLAANEAYAYAIPGVVAGKVVPPSTTTTALVGTSTTDVYSTAKSVQIMDGVGRVIQTQSTPALSGYTGRILAETAYDSQGRTIRANGPWYNSAAGPGTAFYEAQTTKEIPSQTHTVYDGLSRPVTSEFIAYGVLQTISSTAYPGADRVDVTPPTGSAPTTAVADARGKQVQLWQYRTATATGNPADADITTYTYTATGQPATRTDAAGNTWSYTYDLRGRQISSTDPDTGTNTVGYDAAGRVASTTDARGRTVTTTYDLLGRPVATFDGTAADPAKQLTARTYDTVLKDQPSTSTRYTDGAAGAAYTRAITAYDTAYRPTSATTTIPGSEFGTTTPFTYTSKPTYDQVTGLLLNDVLPDAGGIAAERLRYTYEAYGTLQSFAADGGKTYDLSNDYDAYGRPIRTTVNPYGTQIVLTNTYDEPTGRQLTQLVDKQTAATGAVQQTTYAYDPAGRISAIRTIPDNTPSATDLQCFSYDYLNRLTTAWTDTGALNLLPNPTVGGRGACANATPTSGAVAPAKNTVGGSVPYWQDYTYDLTGNRKSLTQHDPSGDSTKDTVTTQTFTASGTVNSGNGKGGPHALMSSTAVTGATSVLNTSTYDAAGNTATQYVYSAGITNYTWNTEGKLDTDKPAVQIQGIGGKCLFMRGSSSATNTPAELSTCNSSGAQRFATTGNLLKIMGKCLTAMGTTSGSEVQLQSCTGNATQTWTPQPNGTVLNTGTNLCLAVPGDVSTTGTATVVATCGTTTVPAGQKWTVPDNSTTYIYDADGNQLVRHNPGKTTVFLGADELTYDTAAKSTTATRTYQMPGGLTLVRQGSTATYQVSDHHGTGNLALDGSTLVETRRATDPFGNPRGAQPTTWAGNHGFVNGTKDDATGLTNLGARQYQPTTGRFISPDPLLGANDPQQWNGYAYSNNNPVNASDPSGLMACRSADECDYGTQIGMNTPTKKGLSTTATATNGHDADGTGPQPRGTKSNGDCCRVQKVEIYRKVSIPEDWDKGEEFIDALYKRLEDFCNNVGHDWGKATCPFTNPDQPAREYDVWINVQGACADIGYKNCPSYLRNWQEGMSLATDAIGPGHDGGGGRISGGSSSPENILASRGFTTSSSAKGLFRSNRESLASCGNSFPPGTLVLMADGTAKPIDQVSQNDTVISSDPETGATNPEPVVATIYTPDDTQFTTLTITDNASGATSKLTSTAHHPYWDATTRQWTDARDLTPGHELQTVQGTATTTAVSTYSTTARAAYNLTVAEFHTYYVVTGNTPILVHNTSPFCGRPFGNRSGGDEFHGSDYSLDEIVQFVHGHTGGGNPAMGRPGPNEIETTLRSAGPVRIGKQNSAQFDYNGVRVIVNYDAPWKSTAYYPGSLGKP
ncbi:RHS repeat-associated core domain-containing protein [Kitasatospora griseola]|uniref:RHS repeat-associated core domain-containing protein n=1 Tax=Kitasatospora griseola TaxID=2064 RepID=UPI0036DC345F